MDELSKSFPEAEGMIDAEQSGKSKRHNENCLNCGTKLIDTFCHHCGQKDIPKRQTLGNYFLISFLPSATLIALSIFAYLLVAMKKMYGQSWRKTTLKYFILLFIFFFCAALGLGVNALFIILMI